MQAGRCLRWFSLSLTNCLNRDDYFTILPCHSCNVHEACFQVLLTLCKSFRIEREGTEGDPSRSFLPCFTLKVPTPNSILYYVCIKIHKIKVKKTSQADRLPPNHRKSWMGMKPNPEGSGGVKPTGRKEPGKSKAKEKQHGEVSW